MRYFTGYFVLSLLIILLLGCGSVEQKSVYGEDVTVTKKQYGGFWPFKEGIDEGVVKCVNATGRRDGEAIFEHKGIQYAMNEEAIAAGKTPHEDIQEENPDYPGVKKSAKKLYEIAIDQCFK